MDAVSRAAEHVHAVAHRAKKDIQEAVKAKKEVAGENLSNVIPGMKHDTKFVDLTVHFGRASGLPKMDIIGSADPYFVARINDRLAYVSSVKGDTREPVWNESWSMQNVPDTGTLLVEVLDKDPDSVSDDYIGQFNLPVNSQAQEYTIELPDRPRRQRGTFWLKIYSQPTSHPDEHPYTFDGPVCYSRHSSPTIGRLTNLDNARLYSTWKVFLRGVSRFLDGEEQPWNRNHKPARQIFQGPTSIPVRTMIHSGHRMLYARTATNEFGTLGSAHDVYSLLHGGHAGKESPKASTGPFAHRIKPAVYNYVIAIEDDSLRFSETGAAFFVNFASKHALHSNAAQSVRYSGEFHPRPEGGWQNFNDDIPDEAVQWELVVDNKSGTYSPDPKYLPKVAELLEYNLPGFKVIPMAYDDPQLDKSTKACRDFALSKRGVSSDELQPHLHPGEQQALVEQTSQITLDGEEPQREETASEGQTQDQS